MRSYGAVRNMCVGLGCPFCVSSVPLLLVCVGVSHCVALCVVGMAITFIGMAITCCATNPDLSMSASDTPYVQLQCVEILA